MNHGLHNVTTGIVTGREVQKNIDGTVEKLLLQVQITDPDDIQTVEQMTQSGEDTNPANGAKVVIVQNGVSYKMAIAVDDGIVPTMNPGEKKLYSISSGAIQAFINLLANGDIELNGNAKSAVSFAELKTAFDQLKSDFDTHIHSGVTTGAGVSGVPTASTTADIDPAEVDTVRLA